MLWVASAQRPLHFWTQQNGRPLDAAKWSGDTIKRFISSRELVHISSILGEGAFLEPSGAMYISPLASGVTKEDGQFVYP